MAVRKPTPQGSQGSRGTKTPVSVEKGQRTRAPRARAAGIEISPVNREHVDPSRRERWRDAARLLVVTVGVAAGLMVVNRTAAGPAVVSALDWAAYLVPPLLVAAGLDLLRRTTRGRPLLHLEEICGLLALFGSGLIAFGAGHRAGPFGNAVADELHLYFGMEGVPLASLALLACGMVLAFHLTGRTAWHGVVIGSRGVSRMAVASGRCLRLLADPGAQAPQAARRRGRRPGGEAARPGQGRTCLAADHSGAFGG